MGKASRRDKRSNERESTRQKVYIALLNSKETRKLILAKSLTFKVFFVSDVFLGCSEIHSNKSSNQKALIKLATLSLAP